MTVEGQYEISQVHTSQGPVAVNPSGFANVPLGLSLPLWVS